jgi:hypothetical protein
MIAYGTLRRRNPSTPQTLEGVFINPSEGGNRPMEKKTRNPRKRLSVELYQPKARRRRRKRKKNNPKKKRKRNRYGQFTNPPQTKTVVKYRYRNPPKKRRRRRRRNPTLVPKRRAPRRNPEHLTNPTGVIKPALAAGVGYLMPGIIWKVIGAKNRSRMMGWFKSNGEAKARATIAAGSTVLMFLLTRWSTMLRSYQKSIMIGSGLRLGVEALGMLESKPGSFGETLRMIVGLPTAESYKGLLTGTVWPTGTGAPQPPAGFKVERGADNQYRLAPISFEDDDMQQYPSADPYGQQAPYGQQDPYGQPGAMPGQPGAMPGQQPGAMPPGNGGIVPYNGGTGTVQVGYDGNGQPLYGYMFRSLEGTRSGAMGAFMRRSVEGYMQRRVAGYGG